MGLLRVVGSRRGEADDALVFSDVENDSGVRDSPGDAPSVVVVGQKLVYRVLADDGVVGRVPRRRRDPLDALYVVDSRGSDVHGRGSARPKKAFAWPRCILAPIQSRTSHASPAPMATAAMPPST